MSLCPSPSNIRSFSHLKLSYITHFYCNQENIDSVVSLFREYETYDPMLLDCIEFIVVDDGSPIVYEMPKFNLNLRWFKINEDIQWNQGGARNLGVTYARSDQIVLVDLDHKIFEETLWYMANHRPCGRDFYKIYRINHTGDGRKYTKGHSNLFFMSRARFMRFFGYDEGFSGYHGGEDVNFVKVQKYHGSRQRYLPKRFLCASRVDLDLKKSYHSLKRESNPINQHILKMDEIKTYGRDYGYSRKFLEGFTWRLLGEYFRANIPQPRVKKWWYYLWYWRWIYGGK